MNKFIKDNKTYISILIVVLICISGFFILSKNELSNKIDNINGGIIDGDNMKNQTDVDNAEHLFDEKGIPYLEIEGVGDVYHPGYVALYALQYSGVETYNEDEKVEKDLSKFEACVDWLENNLVKNKYGQDVWIYNFDSTYNDVEIKAPWYSAFGQAVGIEALIEAYKIDGNPKHLNTAENAAKVLFQDIEEGGLLFQKDEEIWFEEIPVPANNPTHILNGHMRTLIALNKLAKATEKPEYKEWTSKGIKTLQKWLTLYDNGYWLRYDLNPKKTELLFKFNNPYGYKLVDIPIDKITIKDPLTENEKVLDVGANIDSESSLRIAGNDWGQIEELDGNTIRRLKHDIKELNEQTDGPGTYFYLELPSEWTNNLRTEWFEMTIHYKDEKPANISVEIRSIAPGETYQELRDGDLLLTGANEWREWKIPIRTSDLGFWTGEFYAEKHTEYLEKLAKDFPELDHWTKTARGYLNIGRSFDDSSEIVEVKPVQLPSQTPMLPLYSFDKNGVIRQHMVGTNTVLDNGYWDGNSQGGPPVYSPFIVSKQAILESKFITPGDLKGGLMDIDSIFSKFPDYEKKYNWLTNHNINKIKKEPAINWLRKNGQTVKDGLVWLFPFNNVYNDVYQNSNWQSAFAQKYVIDVFLSMDDKDMVQKSVNAYKYRTQTGGLSSFDKSNNIWFEEVPNNSHILNAHLTSLATLNKIVSYLEDEDIKNLYNAGIDSLRKYVYTFDTGYWSRYDQNPKKEILFQIDWLSGDKSPAIDEIILENPQTETMTSIDVGSEKDFEGYPRISGSEWEASEIIDNRTIRRFGNGYTIRQKPIENAHRHNVYFIGALPEREYMDYFDVPAHKLVIKYKDEHPGEFIIKAQSINEGNILTFTPLRDSKIRLVGDGKWKTAEVIIRPQDMGWYMGYDYQKYHVEQLQELVNQADDWYLQQYAEKWEYYLNSYKEGRNVVVENNESSEFIDLALEAKVIESSDMYQGYELENALDGDPNDDYVAAVEGDMPQTFTLQLKNKTILDKIELLWESIENYAVDYSIEAISEDGSSILLADVKEQSFPKQEIQLDNNVVVSTIKFNINKVKGQNRILLRQVKLISKINN